MKRAGKSRESARRCATQALSPSTYPVKETAAVKWISRKAKEGRKLVWIARELAASSAALYRELALSALTLVPGRRT